MSDHTSNPEELRVNGRRVWTHGGPIEDAPTGLNASAAQNATRLNAILAALRSANIISE